MSQSTLTTVCPQCLHAVRVPTDRLADSPRCPACKAALLPGTPVELDAIRFSQVTARTDLPVLVDFWADWCGPCLRFAPVLERAAASFSPRLIVGKVNTEIVPELASRLGIRSIPTLILFRGGREIARTSGAMHEASLAQWVQGALGWTEAA